MLARIKRTGMGALSPAVGISALAALLHSMRSATAHQAVLSAMPVVWSTLLKGRQIPAFFQEVAPPALPTLPEPLRIQVSYILT